MASQPFKLGFRCIDVETMDGAKHRALVIAVQEIPGVPDWVQGILAMDTGGMIQKPIRKFDFERAAHNMVTLIEAREERAGSVLYIPQSAQE